MKKYLIKNKNIIILTIILSLIIHLPILIKDLLTADILLNNMYYNSYSWELSLGRYGLYLIGILKGFISVPYIDTIISIIILSIINVLLIDLFNIKNKLNRLLLIFLVVTIPSISATLLFYYCSIGYLLSFLLSILSVYIFYKYKNKYIKYLIPIILIVLSLSMYQAYLSVLTTILITYNIKLLLDKKLNIKELLQFIVIILISIILYFISMKLVLLIFNINISNYKGASSVGLNLVLDIPNKIKECYIYFYKYYFTNSISKTTYMHTNILNLLVLITLLIKLIYTSIKNKLTTKNKLLLILFILLLPIFLNSIILLIVDTKIQLLMSNSYILILVLLLSIENIKVLKYIELIVLILLIRNNIIQVSSTYLSIEKTNNYYSNIIDKYITKDNLNKEFIVLGEYSSNDKIYKTNYGFISDKGIFWNDYINSKNGFTRYMYYYKGLDINYVDEDTYNEITKSNKKDNNIVIINFNKE